MIITILKILGTVLLVILALALLVLFIPRSVWIEYDKLDGPVIRARILFFKVKVFPFGSGRKKKEPEDGERGKDKREDREAGRSADEEDKKKAEKLTDGIRFSLELVGQVLDTVSEGMRRILRGIKIRDLSFTVPLSGKDSHATRTVFGIVTSAFYNLNTVLQQIFDLEYGSPKFIADFAGNYSDSLYLYCRITAMPFRILLGGAYLFFKGRKILKNNKKEMPAEEAEVDPAA